MQNRSSETPEAGNGTGSRPTTSQQLRKVTDGTTNETLSEALSLLKIEVGSIASILSLASAATESEQPPPFGAVQVVLQGLYDRLGVVSEELERLAETAA